MAKLTNYWHDLPTLQSKEIISELMDSKVNRKASLIISDTGLGKTNSIKLFKRQMPHHTYVLTVGDSYKLEDIINEICLMLGVDIVEPNVWRRINTTKVKLTNIAKRLKEIAGEGHDPQIIIDEAENLKTGVLKMVKELYDAIIDDCSLVLIGTDQILDAILNRKHKNRQSVPQLWRRFKAGTRYVSPLNKARDFAQFFQKYIPGQLDLQDLVMKCAENYGELHDYMEPVMRQAAKNNKPVTEELFRLVHKMPKLKR